MVLRNEVINWYICKEVKAWKGEDLDSYILRQAIS